MKTVTINERSRDQRLHIEAPGCIINITVGLIDAEGRKVTNVSISADGDRYAGDPEWWVEGEYGEGGRSFRIVQSQKGEAKRRQSDV